MAWVYYDATKGDNASKYETNINDWRRSVSSSQAKGWSKNCNNVVLFVLNDDAPTDLDAPPTAGRRSSPNLDTWLVLLVAMKQQGG